MAVSHWALKLIIIGEGNVTNVGIHFMKKTVYFLPWQCFAPRVEHDPLTLTLPASVHGVQRARNTIITSSLRQNDVATSFWRNNDFIIASCVRWVHIETAIWTSLPGHIRCPHNYHWMRFISVWVGLVMWRWRCIVCWWDILIKLNTYFTRCP